MAEKKGFDLASVLSDVSIPDTGREQIEYIDLARIISDGNNFYSLDGIEDLAANIETVGLQQPLRVRRSGADYIIVSGHRRAAAIRLLVKDGRSDLAAVPCIVESGEMSPAMRELRLIYANADTRKMTAADVSRQAERVEALLYQLKEEGYEFPGRMRDHVAEACKVSKTKLARLKVIRENLAGVFLDSWENGSLSESVAYAIAQGGADRQDKLLKYRLGKRKVGSLTEFDVKVFYGNVDDLEKRVCRETGGACGFVDGALLQYAKMPGYYCPCTDRCCAECCKLADCAESCPEAAGAKAEKVAQRAEAEAASEARREEARLRKNAERLAWRGQWLRAGEAMERAGISTEELIDKLPFDVDKEKLNAYLDGTAENVEEALLDDFDEVGDAVRLADFLHTSVDFLLGREGCDAPGAPAWRCGEPPAGGTYWAKFDLDGVTFKRDAYYRTDTKTWSFPHGARIEAACVAWYPLPDDEGG